MMKWMSLTCFGMALSFAAVCVSDEAKPKSPAKAESKEKADVKTEEKVKTEAKAKTSRGPKASQRVLGKIEVTDEQKAKIAEIDQEFSEALKALTKARSAILTPEQKKAEKEAVAANKAASKSAAEGRKAVESALNLDSEQKAKMKEWQASQTEFNGKVVEALKKVLTPAQQEKLPKLGAEKGKKKKASKEPDSK